MSKGFTALKGATITKVEQSWQGVTLYDDADNAYVIKINHPDVWISAGSYNVDLVCKKIKNNLKAVKRPKTTAPTTKDHG